MTGAAAAPAGDQQQVELDRAGGSGEARRLRRGVLSLVVIGAVAIALVSAVPGLQSVGHRMADASPGWVLLALALEWLSCTGFVLAFHLVFPRAPFRFAARVAWSEMAFGAVLPAGGAGGIAVGTWILHAKGFPLARVARRSAILFLLTSAVNVIVLLAAGLGLGIGLLDGPGNAWLAWGPAAVGALTLAFFVALPRAAGRLEHRGGRVAAWARTTAEVVTDTERLLLSRDWRLLGALGYLLFDVAVLWACFRAFGDAPPLAAIVLGYQLGYLGNVLPIPGGVGVLDGGLIGALLLYGTPVTATAAAVLVYHAIVLWVPTLIGAVAFWLVRRGLDEPLELKPPPADVRPA